MSNSFVHNWSDVQTFLHTVSNEGAGNAYFATELFISFGTRNIQTPGNKFIHDSRHNFGWDYNTETSEFMLTHAYCFRPGLSWGISYSVFSCLINEIGFREQKSCLRKVLQYCSLKRVFTRLSDNIVALSRSARPPYLIISGYKRSFWAESSLFSRQLIPDLQSFLESVNAAALALIQDLGCSRWHVVKSLLYSCVCCLILEVT